MVFVGEGADGHTDLFTTTTGGGSVFQLTFTPVVERAPALAASGGMVAFLRSRDTLPETPRSIVIMNLQSGAERIVPLPTGAGAPRQLGWGRGDSVLYIVTTLGAWRAPMPPRGDSASRATGGDSVAALRSMGGWLGASRFAEAIACPSGLCIIGPERDTTLLNPTGRDPMRWGDDSVAWFEGSTIVVRPLGPGRARRATLKDPPANPREGSMGGM